MKIEIEVKPQGKKLNITFAKDDLNKSLNNFVAFFTEHTDVHEIALNFNDQLSLKERTELMGEFTSTVLKINQLNNLKSFILNSTVKDYALADLLNIPVIQQVERLELRHEEQEFQPVNTVDFFERTFVEYLRKNQKLQSLTIEDNLGNITSSKYPKLKLALLAHKSLTHFTQGLIEGMGFSNPDLLSTNLELKLALVRNIPIKPEIKKAELMQSLSKVKASLEGLSHHLEILQVERPKLHSTENGWENVILFSDLQTQNLRKLSREFEQVFGIDDQRIALLNVYLAYIDLIRLTAVLHRQLETTEILLPYRNTLEKFWDEGKNKILHKIIAVGNNDYPEILKEISEIKKDFTLINKKANPVIYPKSYTILTQDIVDPLQKAKALLQDYTKNDSAISRFFHGHWNRHHVKEVNIIVEAMNSGTINNVEDLLQRLNQDIHPENKNGSIARRISFIETKILVAEENIHGTELSMK